MKDEVSHEIVESILIEAGLIEKTYIEESLYTGTRNAFLFILAAIVSPIGIPLFGHVIQQRINSMYYECKSIKDPSEKKNCRLKLLNFVVNIQKQKLKDPKLTDKQRKKFHVMLEHGEIDPKTVKHWGQLPTAKAVGFLR